MFTKRYRQKLALQRQSGLFRDPPVIDRRRGKYIYSGNTRLINFASNDYLGLGGCERLGAKIAAHFARYGASSSSSRLVSGNYERINTAEKAYAEYFGYEDALFFPSGYQANLGVLSTLFEPGDTVLFDKHIHASSVKGVALAGAICRGYNHNHMDHLARRLVRTDAEQAAVVTESLFSMDGDCLPVDALAELKAHHKFFSVIDEAHAFGVLGPGGRGLARPVADVAVGTFGKALGLFGAFALLPRTVKRYLCNFASPQIYTTTLPEAHAAASLDVLEAIAASDERRRNLQAVSQRLKTALIHAGFKVGGDAHILAVTLGEEKLAVAVARKLRAEGIFVLPARYPTVPLKQAILRISLTALHTPADADYFVDRLKQVSAQQKA